MLSEISAPFVRGKCLNPGTCFGVSYPEILFSVNNPAGNVHSSFYFSWKVNSAVSTSTDANYFEKQKKKKPNQM